jgi:hypothetical protein
LLESLLPSPPIRRFMLVGPKNSAADTNTGASAKSAPPPALVGGTAARRDRGMNSCGERVELGHELPQRFEIGGDIVEP